MGEEGEGGEAGKRYPKGTYGYLLLPAESPFRDFLPTETSLCFFVLFFNVTQG